MIKELLEAIENDPPFEDPRLVDGDRWYAKLVRRLKPKFVVELGTGDGRTAAQIAAALHEFSYFVTINWPNPPSGDDVGHELAPWFGSKRIELILGDTREQAYRFFDGTIDLLFIDSTHDFATINVEWILYKPKLAKEAIVIVDDLNHNDMYKFWDPLPYEKCVIENRGVFRYEA
jgi:predicted O-methyltransferase YrrM